jgi:hypothetical protein
MMPIPGGEAGDESSREIAVVIGEEVFMSLLQRGISSFSSKLE